MSVAKAIRNSVFGRKRLSKRIPKIEVGTRPTQAMFGFPIRVVDADTHKLIEEAIRAREEAGR